MPPANDDEATCWFCLSSPKADLDMVVSIGEEIYMAIPKVRRGHIWGMLNFLSPCASTCHVFASTFS